MQAPVTKISFIWVFRFAALVIGFFLGKCTSDNGCSETGQATDLLASLTTTTSNIVAQSVRTVIEPEQQVKTSPAALNASPPPPLPTSSQHGVSKAEAAYSPAVSSPVASVNIRDNEGKDGHEICNSLYKKTGNTNNELAHSPLIYERDDLMVCRVAKVGSNELRCIQRSYELEEEFEYRGNSGCRPHEREGLTYSQLSDVEDVQEFQRYLYGEDVNRIMFVRHPVRRILSGFIEMTTSAVTHEEFWEFYDNVDGTDRGWSPEAFDYWVYNTTFRYEYSGSCSPQSTYFSMEMFLQHWAPPQHCRCGLHDECGVEWKIYKVENIPNISSVMQEYIPGPWIPDKSSIRNAKFFNSRDQSEKYNDVLHSKAHKYDYKEYFEDNPELLDFLNELTKEERDYFGYEPLTI